MILDNASLELFADEGLTTMTEIFFPDQPYNSVQQAISRKPINEIKISRLSSIWSLH
jgi:fructan beta-fructosidase